MVKITAYAHQQNWDALEEAYNQALDSGMSAMSINSALGTYLVSKGVSYAIPALGELIRTVEGRGGVTGEDPFVDKNIFADKDLPYTDWKVVKTTISVIDGGHDPRHDTCHLREETIDEIEKIVKDIKSKSLAVEKAAAFREITLEPGESTEELEGKYRNIFLATHGKGSFQVEGDVKKAMKAGDAFPVPANKKVKISADNGKSITIYIISDENTSIE